MLKKLFRLSGEDLKDFFLKKSEKIKNDVFLIFYQKNNFPYPRFALYCDQKIFKGAVRRNKIRRQIYSIIKELLKEKKIKNYDFFTIVQDKKDFSKLKESLTKILTNA